MKGELSLAFLVTLVFGIAVLYATAQLITPLVGSLSNASTELGKMGVGGTIGALVLTLLGGIIIGLGFAKMEGDIFGIKIGV